MNDKRYDKAAVLVIDDKIENLHVLINCLNNADFETFIAQDGESAIEQLDYVLPDIILLDILMPGIDGYETCSRLKENEKTRDIPVIFMSALSETIDKVKGFNAGAVDYIVKPFQHEEVLARIHLHLTLQRQKKELSKLNAELEESNATKDKFFSIIAHDLRGHFNSLIGGTDLLIQYFHKINEEEKIRLLKSIHIASKEAYTLLSNLLEWSRSQTGRIVCDPVKINLNDVINLNLNLFQQSVKEKNIDLINEIREDIFVCADDAMLNTVIRNLISNSVKFTHSGGSVRICAEKTGYMIEVSVSDTGIGIKEDDLKKLFRADIHHSSRGTAEEHGTGLGLILCKEFVEKNGGNIRIESEEGKGTCSYFTLPTSITPPPDPPLKGEGSFSISPPSLSGKGAGGLGKEVT